MNNTVVEWSTNWTPPSTLNFDNGSSTICAVAGVFLAAVANPPDSNGYVINYNETRAAYVTALLPPNTPKPDNYTLSLWWDSLYYNQSNSEADTNLLNTIVNFPYTCPPNSFCKQLQWSGDGDVSGRGILISYYIAASLSTLYLIALSLRRLGLSQDPRVAEKPKSRCFRLVEAFQESVTSFLESILIFEVSMLGAALVRLSHSFLQVDGSPLVKGEWDFYSIIISPYMSIFSVLPALILQSTEPALPRHWFRIIVWVSTAILALVNEILFETFFQKLFHITSTDQHLSARQITSLDNTQQEWVWLSYCSGLNLLINGILPIYYLGLAVLVLNTVIWIAYHAKKIKPFNKINPLRLNAFFKKWGNRFRVINATVCALVMWIMLGVFTAYRIEVDSKANPDNDNEEWTFGQVVALATWVPAIVEFFTILLHGPEKGLSIKVSMRYEVVPRTEHADGKLQRRQTYSGLPTVYNNESG
ncbi:hypothetical protein F5Y16DRAFT_364311 [Xylariaceae sp. FL0255]|nr:hypothetical protein F5Y16DRAFT_364311 [Xylariaceae sp. FL0255]